MAWMLTRIAGVLGLALAAAAHADLDDDVRLLVRTADLRGAAIGVTVIDGGTGVVLADVEGDRPLIPASNMKLLTTGTALHVLGPGFRFETRFRLDEDRLWIVGDGDPGFGDPDLLAEMRVGDRPGLTAEEFLALLLDPIAAAAPPTLAEIIVDDRLFDVELAHPTWPRDQLNKRYCAEVSGINFHGNVLHFWPSKNGAAPSLDAWEPRSGHVVIRNRGTCATGPDASNTGWFARKEAANEITFFGNVKHDYRVPVAVTMHDPAIFLGNVVAERLADRGIPTRAVRRAGDGDGLPTGAIVAPLIHTPIATAILRCNRDSENLYAEALLKRLAYAATGRPGSWFDGASVVRHVVRERLDDAQLISDLYVADGSGLSRENRVPPALLARWLYSFHADDRAGRILEESLALGGTNGTLARRPGLASDRLDGAIVRAKSGYIDGVSCLSGYVIAGGQTACFSVMVNDLKVPTSKAKALQERIVAAIAESLQSGLVSDIVLGGE